jgi:hypothetical protein
MSRCIAARCANPTAHWPTVCRSRSSIPRTRLVQGSWPSQSAQAADLAAGIELRTVKFEAQRSAAPRRPRSARRRPGCTHRRHRSRPHSPQGVTQPLTPAGSPFDPLPTRSRRFRGTHTGHRRGAQRVPSRRGSPGRARRGIFLLNTWDSNADCACCAWSATTCKPLASQPASHQKRFHKFSARSPTSFDGWGADGGIWNPVSVWQGSERGGFWRDQ